MSLSGVGFASVECTTASSYASYAAYAARDLAGGTLAPVSSASSIQSSIQITSTTSIVIVALPQLVDRNPFAAGIAELLQSLDADNLSQSRQALASLQLSLGSPPAPSLQVPEGKVIEGEVVHAPNTSSPRNGVTTLVSQLSTLLASGNSAHALDQLHNFLEDSGTGRGTAFDVIV